MTPDAAAGYADAMRSLGAASVAYERDRQQLHARYEAEVGRARDAVRQATAELAAAEAAVERAGALADQVDGDAEGAWYGALSLVPRRAVARAEPLPGPADVDPAEELSPVQGADQATGPALAVARLLSEALDLVASVRSRRPAGLRDHAALLLLGAGSALVGYALARGALVLGQRSAAPLGPVAGAAGRITAVLSPLFGLAPLKWFLDRAGVRVGPVVVIVVVLAGVLAVAAAAAFRSLAGL